MVLVRDEPSAPPTFTSASNPGVEAAKTAAGGSVAGLSWRLRRLRAMTPGEVWARLARDVRHRADDLQYRTSRRMWHRRWQPPPLTTTSPNRPLGFMTAERGRDLAEQNPAGAALLVARADAILSGDPSALEYPITASQLQGRDYSLDPLSGYLWPDVHAKRLDYRNAPANPKLIWEINRCQELPILAAASLISGDKRYGEAAAWTLLRWIDEHVPGRGIAWSNGFEAGIRAISLALTYDALAARPDLEERLREPALVALWQHARWIERDPSTHSSANNHRVGELVGLLTVAQLAPELPGSQRWASAALDELCHEATLQILPDGTGAEQSFSYTLFVVDLLLVAVALLDATDIPPPGEVLNALDRAGHALWAQLGRPCEPEPTYGDDDDGRALRLDGLGTRLGRGVASSICARLGNPFARTVADGLDETAWWMFGVAGTQRFNRTGPAGMPGSMLLENAGLAILRRDTTRVTVDAGSLGYLSLAAHGHADALAVTVSSDGVELIVDPGTGTYFGRAAIRSAFRGTGFHATAVVDAKDQSIAGGPFMWSRHARSWFDHVDLSHTLLIAEHDGYLAQADPVRHRRAVLILEPDAIVVFDQLKAAGEHVVSVRWPLHEALTAKIVAPGEVRAQSSAQSGLLLKVAASSAGTMSVAYGEHEPFAGWSSPRLEQIVPSPLVEWNSGFRGRLDVATILCPVKTEVPPLDIALRRDGSGAQIKVVTASRTHLVQVDYDQPRGVWIHQRAPEQANDTETK
jgi:Heparinase II/III-like protein/Heparinase II/III N-terminus